MSTTLFTRSTWRIRAKTLFKNLSGGLKQRVGIACALVNDPEVVFLDEPTTGLDPKARRDVWEAIKALKSRGKTVFLTTHYMDEAYYLADRIDIINHGKIIAEGTPEDLINHYGGGNTLIIRECSSEALDSTDQKRCPPARYRAATSWSGCPKTTAWPASRRPYR